MAAAEKAEAEKILQVKAAEAEAESKYLSGMGIARQRKAIVEGLRDTVSVFAHDVDGTGPKDVMDLLLLTQYFDMIKEIGSKRDSMRRSQEFCIIYNLSQLDMPKVSRTLFHITETSLANKASHSHTHSRIIESLFCRQ